jgi:ankyrin repeat protein
MAELISKEIENGSTIIVNGYNILAKIFKALNTNNINLATYNINLLIANGLSYLLEKKTKNGSTILILCIIRKWIELALSLIQLNILNNICDSNGNSPLITATMFDIEPIVIQLLNKDDIDINHQNNKGLSAFIWACHNNKPDIISAFINPLIIGKHDITLINDSNHDALSWSISNNNSYLSLFLINLSEHISDVYIKMKLACKNKMHDVALKLLKGVNNRFTLFNNFHNIAILIRIANSNELLDIADELNKIQTNTYI